LSVVQAPLATVAPLVSLPVADPDGYPLTGRSSGASPDQPAAEFPSPGGGDPACVIAVVTVEPTSQGRDAVRLPLVIAAVLAAPGP